jgi:hypothetical protein
VYRRWVGYLAVTVATSWFSLAALPQSASAQVAGGDYVRGTVSLDNSINTTITFDASSDPFGANPAGFVDFRTQAGYFRRDEVTCLNVAGNQATIGVRIVEEQSSSSTSFVGWTLNYDVFDGPGTQDRVAFDNIDETGAPPSCAFDPDPPQQELDPVVGGNLEVFDAPGLPKSKDDCKNDGWRQYGFKNQGACIAFVIRKAVQACVFEQVAIGRPTFRSKYGGGRFDLFAFLSCVRQRVDG